ncbi:hypothetical protein Scep_001423 [Stephania cephalantha]|uniref:GTD-binding domain-containing protein n=1 Tax=Stephania cephalantha TaxID=152367 RepID=A0AAP0L9C9_9MAGN
MAMLMESVYFSSKGHDLGSGFWVVFVKMVVLLLMIFWGMKAVIIGCSCKGFVRFLGYEVPRGKSDVLKSIWCLCFDVANLCSLKIGTCKVCFFIFNLLKNSRACSESESLEKSCELVNGISDDDPKSIESFKDDDQEEDKEELKNDDYEEDEGEEEMDLLALKRALSIERKLKNAAYLELEKERNAAASSANEAMAMILRLQNEKSSIQMQADHCFKLAEQQCMHDQEVIESLNWIILNHELERSILENQLNFCKQKLKQYVKPGEEEELEEGTDWTSTNWASTANEDDHGERNKPFEMDSELM